jgi:hypothetical protein
MKRQLLLAISITSLAVTLGIFARFTWPPSDSQSSLDSGAGLTSARVAEVYGQLPLSRSLIGRGEVDVVLMVDGRAANTVRVNVR